MAESEFDFFDMMTFMLWLKQRRNEFPRDSPEWTALDGVLDDVRNSYYTGVPLKART